MKYIIAYIVITCFLYCVCFTLGQLLAYFTVPEIIDLPWIKLGLIMCGIGAVIGGIPLTGLYYCLKRN